MTREDLEDLEDFDRGLALPVAVKTGILAWMGISEPPCPSKHREGSSGGKPNNISKIKHIPKQKFHN